MRLLRTSARMRTMTLVVTSHPTRGTHFVLTGATYGETCTEA